MINALVIVWEGFLSACTGMFHTAAEYVACNYLLMCHSIRQSCDPWCSVDSPENGPRRSLTAFRAELSTHISDTKDNGDTHATIRRRTHMRTPFTWTHKHMHTKTLEWLRQLEKWLLMTEMANNLLWPQGAAETSCVADIANCCLFTHQEVMQQLRVKFLAIWQMWVHYHSLSTSPVTRT